MRKRFEIATVQKDAHHTFIYNKGKKTPIPDSGVVFLYLDNVNLMHATKWTDIAGSKKGVFIMTDEVQAKNGLPCINGKTYTIFGATDTYVYQTSNKADDAKDHTKAEHKGNSVVVPHGTDKNNAALETLRQLYMMLK